MVRSVDLDKYVYTGYGTGFNSRSEFSLADCSVGEMPLFCELI